MQFTHTKICRTPKKNFVAHCDNTTEFNDIDLAIRHLKLNGGGSIYLRGQVTQYTDRCVYLHIHDTTPFRKI